MKGAVALAVGVAGGAVCVAVGVMVGVCVWVAVAVAEGVKVWVGVAEGVGDSVGVRDGGMNWVGVGCRVPVGVPGKPVVVGVTGEGKADGVPVTVGRTGLVTVANRVLEGVAFSRSASARPSHIRATPPTQ